MKSFYLPNKAARLVILQRIELTSSFLKKIRKLFGRNFFTNIITKYFLNSKQIGVKYYEAMQSEFLTFKEYIDFNEDEHFLSIGGGLGGLELIINENLQNIIDAAPEIVSHNLETVRRLTKEVRIQAKYDRSLGVLKYLKENGMRTKTGLMLGLGETESEVIETMRDLQTVGLDVLTIGQYLQPVPGNRWFSLQCFTRPCQDGGKVPARRSRPCWPG